MRTIEIAVATAALVITGCGVGMDHSSNQAGTFAAYQAVGQQMTTTIADYAADTTSLPGDGACDWIHDGYESTMAGLVTRMRQMSVQMDQHMASMGHRGFDMTCIAEAMAAELERHHAVACTGADVTADEREASAHVTSAHRFMEHQRRRYQDAGASMGMMSPPDGSTFTCQKNADGTFTLNGQVWTPGMPVPGSGTCTADACGDSWPMPCGSMMCGGGMGMHP